MLLSQRTMALDMGKGSKRRPQVVSDNEYDKAWEKIFGESRPKGRKKTPPPKKEKYRD